MKKMELASKESRSKAESERFDVTKNISLVPKFSEKFVDKFFPQFEKIAENLKWPIQFWTTMLVSFGGQGCRGLLCSPN